MTTKLSVKKRNKTIDQIVKIVLLVAAIISALMIVLIVWQISGRGLRPFFQFYDVGDELVRVNFISFITGIKYFEPVYHMGYIIINTLYVVILSIIVAAPIGILTALFIAKINCQITIVY